MLVNRQLIAMEEQARPWIVGEPAVIYFFVSKDGSIDFMTYILAKNVGSAVATGVDANAQIIIASEYDSDAISAERDSICDEMRGEPFRNPRAFGTLIAPNDKQRILIETKLGADKIAATLHRKSGPIELVLVGCIDYRFPVSHSHHQTGFAYSISRYNPDRKFFVDNPALEVAGRPLNIGEEPPVEELLIEKDLWGNGYAD